MIQIHETLSISLFATILLMAIFLTMIHLGNTDSFKFYALLLIVGVIALLSFAGTLKLIMI